MLVSKNPYTGEEFASLDEASKNDIDKILATALERFKSWKKTSFDHRADLVRQLSKVLKANSREYAELITREMAKPIHQSESEIEKSVAICDYFAENAEKHLVKEEVQTEADKSYISYAPLGVILEIMPWNYPFFLPLRSAIPALMAGNTVVLKHASNIMQSALKLEQAFEKAGFPEGCFKSIPVGSDNVDVIIRDKRVKAVTITGSRSAGSKVGKSSGEEIKKSVLELGGSNAMVIFKDAAIDSAVDICLKARYENTGQRCDAGKRLFLQSSIADEFLEKFTKKVQDLKSGDPMDKDTFISVMAKESLAENLEKQIQECLKQGAKLHLGGKRDKAYFEPTIITGITPGMPAFTEELFGPVMPVTIFETEQEAIDLVNISDFGLGVSIFSKDVEHAESLIPEFDEGAVFINELVKSDPSLPFGGTKMSGYGREFSKHGIREFTNIKTVVVNKV